MFFNDNRRGRRTFDRINRLVSMVLLNTTVAEGEMPKRKREEENDSAVGKRGKCRAVQSLRSTRQYRTESTERQRERELGERSCWSEERETEIDPGIPSSSGLI